MTGEELGRILFFVLVYGVLLLGAIKIFGIRRVLWFFVFAFASAFKTLDVITNSSRRY